MAELTIVSFSELDTFRQCPLKHQLAYGQRWTREPEEGTPLARGSLWHLVMETHYRVLRWHQQDNQEQTGSWVLDAVRQNEALMYAAEDVNRLLHDPQTGAQTDDQKLIEWMYAGYVSLYGADPDWKIEAVEHPAIWRLPTPSGGRSRFAVKAKIDLVIYDRPTRQRWVIDHKSGKDLPGKKDFDLDDQFGIYTLVARELGFPVMGSLHNAARTYRYKSDKPQPLEERFRRTPMFRTDTELRSIALDTYHAARATRMKLRHSSPDPDRCGWRCDFKDVHLLMRKGADPRGTLTKLGFHQDHNRH